MSASKNNPDGTGGGQLYRDLGGHAACLRLAAAFYARVERDPVLRPFFPGKSFRCAIEQFAAFLAQFLGGPSEDSQRRWWLSLRESHMRFPIGPRERDAWMALMRLALDDAQIEEPWRSGLLHFFGTSSSYIVNQGEACATGDSGRHSHEELSRRWSAQIELDRTATAIREGDAALAIALAEGPAGRTWGPSVHNGVMAAMVRGRAPGMLDYVGRRLAENPDFARERFAGHTLLHDAAAAGCVPVVEQLLALGAEPNGKDDGEHTPIYYVGNECLLEAARPVVRILARAGADLEACDGSVRCTALHMAARRGNLAAAAELLELGARIDPKDIRGDTPLRRAVNCNQIEVARLLLEKGADARSRDSKGLTPIAAAKGAAMRSIFEAYR